MTLKSALLISMIGIILHLLLKLLGMGSHLGVMALLDVLLFEGGVLFFLVVFYLKQ